MSRADIDLKPGPSQPPPHRSGAGRIVHFVGILGRVFVGAGLLLLFYTAYLLWGTGVYTSQEQERATRALESNPLVAEEDIVDGKIPPAKPPQQLPLGSPLWTIKMPKLGVQTVVVEGVGREELKKGPGHFPTCGEVPEGTECVSQAVYPGEKGNVALSGHRTTYGAPFFNLQQLERGDVVDLVSGRARYRYRVREQKIVDDTEFGVVEQHGRDELTLTTCHPRFSAAQRLIIHADYEGASLVGSRGTGGGSGGGLQPGAQPIVAPDVLILASVAIASALGALGLSKRYRAWAVYFSLGIAGAAGLWVGVFPRVIALMPANY